MKSVITLIISISVIGFFFDKYIVSKHLCAWRERIRELYDEVAVSKVGDWRKLTAEANHLFCILFDTIYGNKAFTKHRLKYSILSTLIALFTITLVLGWENTAWPSLFSAANQNGHFSLIFMSVYVLLIICINFIPDFISLCETRWVLRYSRGHGAFGILGFILLDVLLTSLIFIGGYILFLTVYQAMIKGDISIFKGKFYSLFSSSQTHFQFDPLNGNLFKSNQLLLFYLTTFVTSLFWFLYSFTFFMTLVFHRWVALTKYVLDEIGRTQRPASVLSTFLNVIILLGYALYKMIGNV